MESPSVPCPVCAAAVPPANNFCGACGSAVHGAGPGGEVTLVKPVAAPPARPASELPTTTSAAAGSASADDRAGVVGAAGSTTDVGSRSGACAPARRRRGSKGPRRVIITGTLLLLLGSVAASLTASSIQSGVTGIAAEAGSTFIESLLASVGLTGVAVGSDGSGDTSLMLIAAFIGSVLVATVGAVILTVGLLWLLVRLLGRRGADTFTASSPGAAALPGGPNGPRPLTGGNGAVPGAALSTQDELRYQYERARPKLEAAARQSRETYRADIAPRLEQGAAQGKKAASAALARAREARDRRSGG